MASEVDICNLGLSWLAARQIMSLDDASKEAVLCKANYSLMRDFVLEQRAWTFATVRDTLTADATSPNWGYTYRLQLPSTCVRVLMATDDPTNDLNQTDKSFDWRIESDGTNRYLVCDSSTVYIKMIKKITDPALFSPGFVMTLAAKIGEVIAIPLTESSTMKDKMTAMYDDFIKNGANVNGMQGASDQVKGSGLTRVR